MSRSLNLIRRTIATPIKHSTAFKPSNFAQVRSFTKTASIKMSTQGVPQNVQNFLDQIKIRRSTYTLSKETTISDDGVQSIIEQALEEVPSTFGSYTTRIVLATAEQHDKFWALAKDILHGVTKEEQWKASTEKKLDGFAGAYGTVLFFEDPETTRQLAEKFPFAKDRFEPWSEQTNAMHQFVVWTALTLGGNGANLQHYNPLIDEKTKQLFNVPEGWRLVSQLVYGKPFATAGPKPTGMKKPLSERLLIPGKQ